ncbi:hypothetical protein DFH11DRAFT_1743632 [Phellopilus nigrolimitatus]|nr:hypothetical protein DFH11DRAFT_1743632 [Phellopilus nigrolimitatus]
MKDAMLKEKLKVRREVTGRFNTGAANESRSVHSRVAFACCLRPLTTTTLTFESTSKLDLSRLCNPAEGEEEGPSPPPSSPEPPPSRSPEANTPSLSFIVIAEASKEGRVTYVSESVSDVVGYDAAEAIGLPASCFAHMDDVAQLYNVYQQMIKEDKAACLLYLRIPYKDPHKGYLLCSVSCTRVGRQLIGGVSAATSSVKAMQWASTAQEVFVIAPSASEFVFRRWNDPAATVTDAAEPVETETSPPISTRTSMSSAPSQSSTDSSPTIPPLTLSEFAPQSINSQRTALILERFSMNCTVLHITNDDMFSTPLIMGRSFYDFIAAKDEKRVRSALDTVKGWGVNERGHPSDGGFAFNKFTVLLQGRDSSADPPPPRGHGRHAQQSSSKYPYRAHVSSDHTKSSSSRSRMKSHSISKRAAGPSGRERSTEMKVDAIFSPQSDGIIVILRPSPHE